MNLFKAAKQLIATTAATALLSSLAFAAPPGELPFGVYDPDGDFANDGEVPVDDKAIMVVGSMLPKHLNIAHVIVARSRDYEVR